MPLRLAKPKPKDPVAEFGAWLAETFTVPSGISRGEPLTLHPFQADFIRAHLARDLDGSPTYRTCVFSTPRKQGKTSIIAALLLGYLCPDSPLYIPKFKAAVAAPTEKHATYIAEAMLDLMEAAGREGELETRFNPRPGKLELGKGQVLLSTGATSQGHGQDLELAVVDECGLIAKNQSELITAFFDALAAKDGQLILTGTRGDAHAYNEIIDRPDARTHVSLYAAPLEADPSDPEVWEASNPGLGSIKSRRFMEDAYLKAAKSGSTTEFEVWHLNKPLSPVRQLLLDYATLRKAYVQDAEVLIQEGEPVHVGIDLGGSASMTAATLCYEQSGVIKVLGAFPGADMDLHARGQRDQVGDLWFRCHQAGELIETSGSVSDLNEFLPEVVKLIGNHPISSVSCDRYRHAEFDTALARQKLSWPIIYRGTGPKDGDADIRLTRRLFLAGAVKLKRSILLEGSLGEADVRMSATGACRLDKSHPHARIDVAQSLVLACSAMLRAREVVLPEYEVEVI